MKRMIGLLSTAVLLSCLSNQAVAGPAEQALATKINRTLDPIAKDKGSQVPNGHDLRDQILKSVKDAITAAGNANNATERSVQEAAILALTAQITKTDQGVEEVKWLRKLLVSIMVRTLAKYNDQRTAIEEAEMICAGILTDDGKNTTSAGPVDEGQRDKAQNNVCKDLMHDAKNAAGPAAVQADAHRLLQKEHDQYPGNNPLQDWLDKINKGSNVPDNTMAQPGTNSTAGESSSERPGAPAPDGSSLFVPSQASANGEVLCTVFAPNHAVAQGVVVTAGGQSRVTNEKGQVIFAAGSAGAMMTVSLLTSTGSQTKQIGVMPSAGSAPTSITSAPKYMAVGDQTVLQGTGFQAGNTTVSVGGTQASVLAASDVELDVVPASSTPLGPQQIAVTSPSGSATASTSAVALSVNAVRTVNTGGSLVVSVGVTGTGNAIPVRVDVATPNTLQVKGGDHQVVRTSGGTPNTATLKARAAQAGAFSISATVAPSR